LGHPKYRSTTDKYTLRNDDYYEILFLSWVERNSRRLTLKKLSTYWRTNTRQFTLLVWSSGHAPFNSVLVKTPCTVCIASFLVFHSHWRYLKQIDFYIIYIFHYIIYVYIIYVFYVRQVCHCLSSFSYTGY